MNLAYHTEIVELHQFFVDWFCGTLPQTEATFHRFSGVMADEMHIISPDGQILASGSWDNTVRLWNIWDGTMLRFLEGHTDNIYTVAFTPDGQKVASVSDDQSVRIWWVGDGSPYYTLEGHPNSVLSLSFSPNGQLLASAGADPQVRLWDIQNGTLYNTLERQSNIVESVTLSEDGKFFVISVVLFTQLIGHYGGKFEI